MTEYKILSRKTFGKEATLLDDINNEARSGWRVISIGYEAGGTITKAVLERNKNNQPNNH
ncbi:MAG: hypothetical protein PSN34_05005 [Urechidicola sp.]|nr:hypothetical protein [Urechidicola sp.]